MKICLQERVLDNAAFTVQADSIRVLGPRLQGGKQFRVYYRLYYVYIRADHKKYISRAAYLFTCLKAVVQRSKSKVCGPDELLAVSDARFSSMSSLK